MLSNANIVYVSPNVTDYLFQTVAISCKGVNTLYSSISLLKIASLSFEHPLNKYGAFPMLICIWGLGALRVNQLVDEYLLNSPPEKLAEQPSLLPAPSSSPVIQKHSWLLSCIKSPTYVIDSLPRLAAITIGHGIKYASVLSIAALGVLPYIAFLPSQDTVLNLLSYLILTSARFYPFFIGAFLLSRIVYFNLDITVRVIIEGPSILNKLRCQ
jgi:hypothetical protein